MNNKEEFYLNMDIQDLTDAGAFISKEIWEEYIIKHDNNSIRIINK